jgi:predicted YcjX-like family ATPase
MKRHAARPSFRNYLGRAAPTQYHFSTLPPGRFLMPGDLEELSRLDFRTARRRGNETYAPSSFAAMMEQRYKPTSPCRQPFFAIISQGSIARSHRHARRIERGTAAMRDLETALTDVMAAFRARQSPRPCSGQR